MHESKTHTVKHDTVKHDTVLVQITTKYSISLVKLFSRDKSFPQSNKYDWNLVIEKNNRKWNENQS